MRLTRAKLWRGLTFEERFWANVETAGPDECWEWTGGKSGGYGHLYNGEREEHAHRVMWRLTYGEIGDMFVCHRCDNPGCVNPNHLFLGTQQQNMADASKKGRVTRGEAMHSAKLTEDDIRDIRQAVSQGAKQNSIAKQYGVSTGNINLVVKRKRWGWLE